MKKAFAEPAALKTVRCVCYTRKSTEEGLEQEFNSLDAQRESATAFVAGQRHECWTLLPDRYDDGGFCLRRARLGRGGVEAVSGD